MKIKLITTIWIFIGIHFCLGVPPCNPPTNEQCGKLADAISKSPPNSIDITFNEKIFRKPMSEKEIRNIFSRSDRPKDKMNDEGRKQFEKDVQINVERVLKEQSLGVNVRKRIRLIGDCQRIDQITIKPQDGNSNTDTNLPGVNGAAYDTTYVVSGQTGKTCYHAMKTMEIRQRKKEQMDNGNIKDATDFSMLGLQGLLADKQNSSTGFIYVPSPEKIETLARTGKVSNTEVRICPEPNAIQSKERIEIRDADSQVVTAIFVCDINDYSHIYYTEIRMPPAGKPFYIKECSNFNSSGIPRNITVTEFEFDGGLKEKKKYEILDVNLNSAISKDVFEFTPPEEYKIIEVEPNGMRTVIREKGGIEGVMLRWTKAVEEKDIKTLKELLGHEIWQVRLRSLQILEHLLAQDKQGLKDAAAMLENDEKPEVRETAQRILNRLKSEDPNVK